MQSLGSGMEAPAPCNLDAPLSLADINECLSISAPCPAGQACINTEGSYTCQKNVPNCGRGYHLNEEGTRCVGWYQKRGNRAEADLYTHTHPEAELGPE